jgi:Ran GTPase-activating protein (RanGAP) involved in mRNA processing and transport
VALLRARLAALLLLAVAGASAAAGASMAWGAKAGATDWCRRLSANDKSLSSLLVLRTRSMKTEDWIEFCGALAGNTELRELKASSHSLDAAALAAFSDMLAKNTALERLALGDAELGDSGVAALCPGLASNTALQEIELDYKGLTPAGASALASALKANRALRRLLLSRNPALGDAGVSALCEGLCESSVQDLQLEEIGMTDVGAHALATALSRVRGTMTEVSLSGNELLTGEGTGALFAGISSGPGVESLKLDYCPRALSADASSKLGDLLRAPGCKLQRLSFHTVVPPDDESKRAIASAVGAATSLREAKLVNMELCDAGAAALASAMAASTASALELLDLTGNQLTGEGLASLILTDDALGRCKRLAVFDNRVGTGVHLPTRLQEAAASGRHVGGELEDLDLGGNKLEKEWILELLTALYATPGLFPALRTLGLGGNEGMQDADDELEAAVEALQERAVPLDVVYKAMGDDGKAGANARANQLASQMAENGGGQEALN